MPDSVTFIFIADDAVIKTGLPGKIGIDFPGMQGNDSFVLVDDYPQCVGFPFFVILAGWDCCRCP